MSLLQVRNLNKALLTTISTSKTFTGSATTVYVPLFRVVGAVRVNRLYAVVTTTLGGSHTAAAFVLNNQTTRQDITESAIGGDFSTYPAGSFFQKTDLKGAALAPVDATTGFVIDPFAYGLPVQTEFIALAKTGANTDIEYTYTTASTPTTGAATFFCEYQILSAGGSLTAL